MKIFITGATGYIGRHVLQALIHKGYQVFALTRSKRQSNASQVTWIQGDLHDLESLAVDLSEFDSVIHLAMDYQDNEENVQLDQNTINTYIKKARHLVYTGNLFNTTTPGDIIKEETYPDDNSFRVALENQLLSSNVSAAIVRPGFVYGGQGGFLWQMIPVQEDGNLYYVDNPLAHWPMIHVKDIAELYAHIVENQLSGIFHGHDGEKTPVSEVIETLSKIYRSPLKATNFEQAESFLGKVATFMNTDYPVETEATFATNWVPQNAGFSSQAAQAYQEYLIYRQD